MESPTIFISYAHIDDQPLVEGERGWITAFHMVLEKRLAMLLGEPPRIWRDRELRGNDHFDDAIARQYDGAGVFVAVVSPRYVRSDYCRKELEAFCQAAIDADRDRLGDQAPIFKVIKTPVDLEAHPPSMRGLLGYEFYTRDPATNRMRELSLDAQRDRFLVLLDDLAQEMRDLLTALEPSDTPKKAGRTVYLTPGTTDMRDHHDVLRRGLVEDGHRVLPDAALPVAGTALQAAVRDSLEQADLAVHLVGAKYGFVPEDETRSAAQLQLELSADATSTAGLARVIWTPPGLEARDPRQRAWLDALRSDPAALQGADLLETTLETLQETLRARLSAPTATETTEAAAESTGEEGPRWVYLMHDPKDTDAVAPVEDVLWDAGLEVRTPLYDGDEAEVREEHEENLRLCDGFLVFYGQGNERWLRKSLGDLKRARGLGRKHPIEAKAVLVAAPSTPRKARYRTHEATVLTSTEVFEPACLRPFLEALTRP